MHFDFANILIFHYHLNFMQTYYDDSHRSCVLILAHLSGWGRRGRLTLVYLINYLQIVILLRFISK